MNAPEKLVDINTRKAITPTELRIRETMKRIKERFWPEELRTLIPASVEKPLHALARISQGLITRYGHAPQFREDEWEIIHELERASGQHWPYIFQNEAGWCFPVIAFSRLLKEIATHLQLE